MINVPRRAARLFATVIAVMPLTAAFTAQSAAADTLSIDANNHGGAWEGFYLGGTLGYGISGDDVVGIRDTGSSRLLGDAGKLKISGANGGIHLGYRWQSGKIVLGPELSYERTNVKDEVSGTVDSVSYTTESAVKDIVTLKLKSGYVVNGDLLIYGEGGIVWGSVDYKINGVESNYDTTGYTLGLGIEKKIDDQWSVFGAYDFVGFKKKDRSFGDISTRATPDFGNLKVGVNFKY